MDWRRDWDWGLAVEVQRRPLAWVVMVLFSMAGLVAGAVVETLPRERHRAVLGRLRRAESAVRRLIVMAMRAQNSDESDASWTPQAEKKRGRKGGKRGERNAETVPAFRLFDPRRYIGRRRRTAPGYGPRVWLLDGSDDPVQHPAVPQADDPVSARQVCLRLLALRDALDDLPRQAQRMRRALSRSGRKWPSPLRPGRPPGYRERGRELIDEILDETQVQALWALKPFEPG